ncbi:MAG: hypothetical protein A3H93_14375 [Rhodocyclales bacterium RIFCSPLOWO2_02_FULL_63_24]|nr:MAG: hypothetical protein A3H93_14375 [Rhodocyclales bacterium RIFCSPLOWO2_02_FULL_63_24]
MGGRIEGDFGSGKRLGDRWNRVLMSGAACLQGRDSYFDVGLVSGDGDFLANDGAFDNLVFVLFFVNARASLDIFIACAVDPIRRGDVVLDLLDKLFLRFAAEDGQIVEKLRLLVVGAYVI